MGGDGDLPIVFLPENACTLSGRSHPGKTDCAQAKQGWWGGWNPAVGGLVGVYGGVVVGPRSGWDPGVMGWLGPWVVGWLGPRVVGG